MRACNGCRRRKIKCDAATTNTWPCSACTRLKLVCVPPTIGQDGDFNSESQDTERSDVGSTSVVTEAPSHGYLVPAPYRHTNPTSMGTLSSYGGLNMYSQLVQGVPNQPGLYNDMGSSSLVMPQQSYQQAPIYPSSEPSSFAPANHGLYIDTTDSSTAENLSDVLGELRIDETGIGMRLLFRPRSCEGWIS